MKIIRVKASSAEGIESCQGSSCQHFDHDVFGNLRQVILDNGIQLDYLIDGRNRRIGTKVNGVLIQGFLYDDQLRVVAELDGANQVVAKFTYADGINVPELMEKNGRTYRLLHDHLGSPRLVVDTATGEIAQELHYDAWGNVTYDSNPGFQPFGFTGGLYDRHTRLVRFGARDYDSEIGRWHRRDPVRFGDRSACGAGNLFFYGCADPVNRLDPAGLYSKAGEECRGLDVDLAVTVVCARMVGKCEDTLRKFGLLECMRTACRDDQECPKIVCARSRHCGVYEEPSCWITIDPTKHSWGGGACGSPDSTIFHEFLHYCGLGEPPQEPAKWREISAYCGKDIPAGYDF